MSETKHPERRVGQTWRYLNDGGSAFTLGERAFQAAADAATVHASHETIAAVAHPAWSLRRKDPKTASEYYEAETVCSKCRAAACVCDALTPPAPEAPKAETVAYLLKCGFRVTGDSKAQADSARVGHEANCIDCNPMLQPTQYREPHPPAPQPAPAKPHDFSDPYCARRRAMGTVARLCITCGAAQDIVEARTDIDCRPNHGWREVSEMALCDSDGILRDGKVPERIERPKLAHSYGVECPALEDA